MSKEAATGTTKNSLVVGNCAKLREALEAIINGYKNADLCDMNYGEWCHDPANVCVNVPLCKAIHEARAALAAPPRNCDIAQDRLCDLYVKFKPPASVKREMPPEWVDAVMAFCRWLLAPATEQKGGVK